LRARGQPALATHELLGLPEIKADKQTAAARLRQAGADAILLVRLVDRQSYARQVQATPSAYRPVATGYDTYDWHAYYTIAFTDMSAVWTSVRDYIYIDVSLFDLATGRRLWSGLTETVIKEDMDRVAEVTPLAKKILAAIHKDGLIR
jgi:hypothetical protein